ncbi:S8 family serine peptidase [Candidatus Bathyarchaeota archaeon]|nr:S8 family serine peptidase [Candidatus Bathyarchaeota archaeon]
MSRTLKYFRIVIVMLVVCAMINVETTFVVATSLGARHAPDLAVSDVSLGKEAVLSQATENVPLSPLDGESCEFVVGLNVTSPGSYSGLASLVGEVGGRIVNEVSMGGEAVAIVADLPSTVALSFTRRVHVSGFSRYIEPRMEFKAQFEPNDPYWAVQWGPQKIGADYAWNTTVGDSSVLVAVIDTGIDYNHPDLAANYVAGGGNWVNGGGDPLDDHGHGTHTAGIIAAALNNNVGIAGLAQIRILAEKGLDNNGTGKEDNLAQAIIDAVDRGAKILSNSWGGEGDSNLIHDAIRYAYAHGVLVVASAGNGASNTKTYPAAYKEVIAVTATDQSDSSAYFTSYGDWVELAAPGVSILSTMPTYHVTMNDLGYAMNYANMGGTSMACPHVVGVAALIWSKFPDATRDWVSARLRSTADDLGESGFDQYYGYGRINARRAVEQVAPEHDLLILDWTKPKYIQPEDTAALHVTVLNSGTSDEYNVTAELLVNSSLVGSAFIGNLTSGAAVTVNLSWTPLSEGFFNVTLYVVPVDGETAVDNNRVTSTVSAHTMLTLSKSADSVGAKVTAMGRDFLLGTSLTLMFNDVLMGFATVDEFGNFTFTFNVPNAAAGMQSVKVQDAEGNYLSTAFTVTDVTPLVVQIDVGSTYFIGEVAEYYIQTTFKGQPVTANITGAMLYKPDGSTENLAVEPVAVGLYKSPYTLTQNETGTYTLVVEASYLTDTTRSEGASFKCFSVSSTMSLMNKQVVEIKDGIAVVQADLNTVKLNLTAINATLDNIFLDILAVKETAVTVQTTIGLMNGTIIAMDGDVATILVQGVGQIKTDISEFRNPQQTWTFPLEVILLVSLIAAISALSSAIVVSRRKTVTIEANH